MPVQDAPGLSRVLPIPWPHRSPSMPPLAPTPQGQCPTQGLWGLSCSLPTIQLLLLLLPWHARHARPSSAKSHALRGRGWALLGQHWGPQGVALMGSAALLSYAERLEAQKQRTTCPPPSPSPTPLPEGQVLGQTVSQVQAEQQTGKSKHCGPPLCRATARQDGTQLLRVALAAAAAGTPRVNDLGFLPSQRSLTARRERQQQGRMGRDKSSGSWASEGWGPPCHPAMSFSRGQGT